MIHWEARGHVGVATIDREDRRNALNAELCAEMLRLLESNPSCRAVVITGRGTAFSAGADLGTRFGDEGPAAEQAHSTTDTFRPIFEHLMEAIDDYAAPVIAAINGPAIGAGLQLAVGCDLRVVSRDAMLGIPAGRLGVFLSPSNIERLGMLVGQGAARGGARRRRDVHRGGSASQGPRRTVSSTTCSRRRSSGPKRSRSSRR